jgi:hypothetical protein
MITPTCKTSNSLAIYKLKTRTKILFAGLLFSAGAVYGQDSLSVNPFRLRYWNSIATGVLLGESEKNFTGSLITAHGIAIKRWRLGLGVGIEGYDDWRTVPLFVTGSFDFGRINNNWLYLQMSGGHAFGRYIAEIEGSSNGEEDGGLMLNPMIGYRLNANKFSVSIAAGYKLQRLDYSFDWIWGWPAATTVIDGEFHRLMFQVGVGFN